MDKIKVVFSGAGAAGMAIALLLLEAGVSHMAMVDSQGIIAVGRDGMNVYKDRLAEKINPQKESGNLEDALVGADVFVGVSKPGVLTAAMIQCMAPQPIIFAMANPIPEIMPEEAHAAGAAVVATGRSDFPNQVNNVLVFPGLFKGVLEGRIRYITTPMKIAAAHALARMVEEPTVTHIIPDPFNKEVAIAVADAVRKAALV